MLQQSQKKPKSGLKKGKIGPRLQRPGQMIEQLEQQTLQLEQRIELDELDPQIERPSERFVKPVARIAVLLEKAVENSVLKPGT